jgi:hypothetical protein
MSGSGCFFAKLVCESVFINVYYGLLIFGTIIVVRGCNDGIISLSELELDF